MTETAMDFSKKDTEVRQRAMFEDMIEDFTKRYRPDDPYEMAQFDRALFSLVRQIYADAQAPILDRFMKLAGLTALPGPLQR